MSGAGNLGADLGIDRGGGADRRAAGFGQEGDAGEAGSVKRAGGVQHPLGEKAHAVIGFAEGAEALCGEARVAQPFGGEVAAAGPSILADIARDIGELHREAEIAGAGECHRAAHAHHQRHHHADGGGDARGIGFHVCQSLEPAAVRVPFEAFDQRGGDGERNAVGLQYPGEGAVDTRGIGLARIGETEAAADILQRGFGMGAFVHGVIGDAAKGIEGVSGGAHIARQQQGSGVETLGAIPDDAPASGQIRSQFSCVVGA